MARKKSRAVEPTAEVHRDPPADTGAASAGQSGDLQGLSGSEESENESVRELIEEGQFYEAAAVEGVENAPDADEGEVRTREVPEDDVPDEYKNPREQE